MRVRKIVQPVVGLLGTLGVASLCYAQAANPAVNISSVVRGGVVVVSYDLVSTDPSAQFSVGLDVSADGGKTYAVRPKTVKGDVGTAVKAGTGKQITWEAARDVENLEVDRYRYRVTAVRQGATANAAPAPVQTPGPAVRPSSGTGLKWAGIGLLGGGGALMFLGMQKETSCDVHGNCFDESKNKPMLWAGLAAAGGGVALLTVGASRNNVTQVVFRPGGVMVQQRLRPRWLTGAK